MTKEFIITTIENMKFIRHEKGSFAWMPGQILHNNCGGRSQIRKAEDGYECRTCGEKVPPMLKLMIKLEGVKVYEASAIYNETM